MSFRITGLSPDAFSRLFELSDAQLQARQAIRVVAQADGGYPCRISLCDASPGEELILTHFQHHPVDSPFRASHAIYVRAGQQRYNGIDTVPEQLRKRLLSLRAFDDNGMLLDADVVDGAVLEPLIARMLADSRAAYLHIHFAKAGCYAARVDRN
jgi:hypothetical protein